MLGPVDWVIWVLATLLEAAVVVCSIHRKAFKRYFLLNLYMLLSVLVSIMRFQVLMSHTTASDEYRYTYFYSDALLTITLFFAVIGLYSRVFQELKVEGYLRFGAVLTLAGTAWFSYSVVNQSTTRILTHFVFELSQNLYFVGLVLTYVLWGAILKLRETRALLVQLVLSLGIYFSAFAATYAVSNLNPTLYSYIRNLPPLFACLLPLAWAYAIMRVPEDARLEPARIASMVTR
jgi:hypothetical protein